MKNSSNFLYVLAKQCWSPFNSTDFFLIFCFIRNLLGQTPGISGFLLSWNLWFHFRLVDYQWCQWQVLHWFHSVWNRQNLMQMLQLMSLKKPKMIITGLFNWPNCSIVVSGSPIVAQVRRKKTVLRCYLCSYNCGHHSRMMKKNFL